jgi:hypothetical protein
MLFYSLVLWMLSATEVTRVQSGGFQILVTDSIIVATRPVARIVGCAGTTFCRHSILLNRNLTDARGFASTIAPLNEVGQVQIAGVAGKKPSTLGVDRSEAPNAPRLPALGCPRFGDFSVSWKFLADDSSRFGPDYGGREYGRAIDRNAGAAGGGFPPAQG